MRTLLNIVWFVFGGLWLALGYALAGVVLCLLVVTIPLGVASFRMARYTLWPFGRAVVDKPGAGAGAVVLNVVWLVLAGWWLALGHLTTAAAQAVTIVGIPLAVANLKLIPVSLVPYGKDIVRSDSLPPGERPLHSF
ncbi:YccF domain-containing protein [Phycicoccus sp. CSK15P-2]|uniref:YccF domain-containing protein n=1 Tax=Phycicoccus sp. CSK15P-2 TaxID=2807627 RepID=UPI00194E7B51|nr:YccF domain-containing protein [Phycicoccus sp. CSK15P-2]MBM6405013.1 YccF domain-containing protein [Phycicoccus sp. CSK15P-2]